MEVVCCIAFIDACSLRDPIFCRDSLSGIWALGDKEIEKSFHSNLNVFVSNQTKLWAARWIRLTALRKLQLPLFLIVECEMHCQMIFNITEKRRTIRSRTSASVHQFLASPLGSGIMQLIPEFVTYPTIFQRSFGSSPTTPSKGVLSLDSVVMEQSFS